MKRLAKTMAVAFLSGVAFVLLMLALTGCDAGPGSTWPDSDEFEHIETGADRFSRHDTNLSEWEVIVDHSTGVQYLYRYKYGLCPLLDVDGMPLLVLEAGE